MIPFHIPTLADRAWAEPLLRAAGDLTSESAFGTYFLWQDRYQYEIAQVNGYFAARSIHGYALPAGTGDLRPVLDALRADAAGRGIPPCFSFSRALFSYCLAFSNNVSIIVIV